MSDLKSLDLGDCERVGLGARRPEDVAVSAAGEVQVQRPSATCNPRSARHHGWLRVRCGRQLVGDAGHGQQDCSHYTSG